MPGISRSRLVRYRRSRSRVFACSSSRVIWASSRRAWNSVMRRLAPRPPRWRSCSGHLARAAVVVEGVALVGQLVVVGQDGAAFAGAEVLAHLEAEAAGGAPGAHACGRATRPRWAWQASSTTGRLRFLAIARIASRSHGEPPMCTGMIAAVRSVIAASILRGVDLEGLAVGVDEDRQGVVQQDDVDAWPRRCRAARSPRRPARRPGRPATRRGRWCRWRWPRSTWRRSAARRPPRTGSPSAVAAEPLAAVQHLQQGRLPRARR